MKIFFKLVLVVMLISMTGTVAASQTQTMSPDQMRQFIQQALYYGFDMNTTDYTKYMSPDYIEHIDGKTFNSQQWLHHMLGLKKLMKSFQLTFNEIVVEGNNVAASYDVHATKKDGENLVVRIIAIFKIKDGKVVYCNELTHLLTGPKTDENLSDQD